MEREQERVLAYHKSKVIPYQDLAEISGGIMDMGMGRALGLKCLGPSGGEARDFKGNRMAGPDFIIDK